MDMYSHLQRMNKKRWTRYSICSWLRFFLVLVEWCVGSGKVVSVAHEQAGQGAKAYDGGPHQ